MNIYLVCSVRNCSDGDLESLTGYVSGLESIGHTVHFPHRDTNQGETGINICEQNTEAMMSCDEAHIFFDKTSFGSHFDLGVLFALKKKIVVIKNVSYGEGKSFPRMIDEWESRKKP